MVNKALYSSNSDEWATPQEVFDSLDAEFHFDLDPCATDENHKCERYFTLENSGLEQNWGGVSSILQSSIFRDFQVGRESIQRNKARRNSRCVIDSFEN